MRRLQQSADVEKVWIAQATGRRAERKAPTST
jgi:hypothetical protein